MMIEEFEQRTGYRPTWDEYKRIEADYMKGNADKDTFCNRWLMDGGIENERKKIKMGWVEYAYHFTGKRHTNRSLMEKVFEIIETMPEFEKARSILDYKLAESFDVQEITNYRFDFLAVPNFGCEGIYIDCWLQGEFCDVPKKRIGMGTLKTLTASMETMQIMGELAGLLTWVAHDYINQEIDIFTPEGERQKEYMEIA
jgi:hypothetical protein